MADVSDENPLEDDWEILRRIPDADRFTTTIDMAEAIERICKGVVDFALLVGDKDKTELRLKNLYPLFTIIPFWDTATGKHLWKANLAWEELALKYMTKPHDRCEQAVEELFAAVRASILVKSKEFAKDAEEAEQESYAFRDVSRKLQRITSAMGSYDPTQPNLPLKAE